jgi:hypothetical protein
MRAKKIILVDEHNSVVDRIGFIRQLFDDRIELLITVGHDSELWADLMSEVMCMAQIDEGIDHFVALCWLTESQIDKAVTLANQVSIPSGLDVIEILGV